MGTPVVMMEKVETKMEEEFLSRVRWVHWAMDGR
jgi:hypothetical protein